MNIAEIRETLKTEAGAQVQQYPQYRGHFDDYVLVRARKNVKSKMGPSFVKDELAIARPVVYEFQRTMPSGRVKTYHTIVVWSNTNRCDTHVIINEIQILEDVKLSHDTL